jgi:hypothetical protein
LHILHDGIEIEARGLLTNRELLEALEPLRRQGLHGYLDKGAIGHPLVVFNRFIAPLKRIGTQIEELGHPKVGELTLPDVDPFVGLLQEHALPFVDADCDQLTVVIPIDEILARRLLHVALEKGDEIEAVEMDLEGLAADLIDESGRRLGTMSWTISGCEAAPPRMAQPSCAAVAHNKILNGASVISPPFIGVELTSWKARTRPKQSPVLTPELAPLMASSRKRTRKLDLFCNLRLLREEASDDTQQLERAVGLGHVVVATGGTRLLFVALHGK